MKNKKVRLIIIIVLAAAIVLGAVATGLGIHFSKKPSETPPNDNTPSGDDGTDEPNPQDPDPTKPVEYKNSDGLIFETTPAGVVVVGYKGTAKDVVITDKYGDSSIAAISSEAFAGCSEITSVTVAGGIAKIGNKAFENCGKLSRASFGEGLTSIGRSAFSDCYSLKELDLPSTLTSVEKNAFDNCLLLVHVRNLSRVDLSKEISPVIAGEILTDSTAEFVNALENDGGVSTYTVGGKKYLVGYQRDGQSFDISGKGITDIAPFAVYGNRSLVRVTVPGEVKRVSGNAFNACINVLEVTVEQGVESLEAGIFSGCFKIIHVTNLSGLKLSVNTSEEQETRTDKTKAFENAIVFEKNGMISLSVPRPSQKYVLGYCGTDAELAIPTGYTDIYPYAFYENDSIETVTVHRGIKTVGEHAFSGSAVKSVVFAADSDIKTIGDYAFAYCNSLESLTFGSSLSSLGEFALTGCPAFTDIYYNGTKEEWSEKSLDISFDMASSTFSTVAERYRVSCNGELYYVVEDEFKLLYRADLGAEVLVLTQYLSRFSSSGRVAVPESSFGIRVVEIDTEAFYRVSGLDEVDIPQSILIIGDKAFNYCYIHKVNYDGNKAQWRTMVRATNADNEETWIYPTTELTVYCSDGVFVK